MQKSDRLVIKKNLDTLRNNNNVLTDAVTKLSKHDENFSVEFASIFKNISKSSL